MKYNFTLSLFVVGLLTLVLSGCFENSLKFKIRFSEISGLEQNAPVFFENNRIGAVRDISYTEEGDYLVAVKIFADFSNAATRESVFYIENSPDNQQEKAVVVTQKQAGGVVLREGTIVQGATTNRYLDSIIGDIQHKAEETEDELRRALEEVKQSLQATSTKLDSEMQQTLAQLSRKLQSFTNELHKAPDSEEIKQLEKNLQSFVDQFNKAQQDVRDHLREEVLPQLRKELERLRQQLQQENRQDELKEIEQQMDTITVV